MYGKDIKKWLDTEKKLEVYDFRKEVVDFKGDENAIDKYKIYKAIGIAEEDIKDKEKGKDPCRNYAYTESQSVYNEYERRISPSDKEADNSKLIQEIVKLLWQKELLQPCLDQQELKCDTMNSCFTTLYQWMKRKMKDPSNSEKIVNAEKMCGTPSNRKLLLLLCPEENKDWCREVLHTAESFLNVAYTIGNFIPVPKGCNGPRGTGPTEDYWDLALYSIYQWYRDNERLMKESMEWPKNEALCHLLGTKIDLYQNWLAAFGSWDRFVIANFMQDFVNPAGATDKGIFGCPKELWGGHFNGKVLPTEYKHFEEFFSRAAEWISARSVRMVNALGKKIGIA